jgi:hypothetical protein
LFRTLTRKFAQPLAESFLSGSSTRRRISVGWQFTMLGKKYHFCTIPITLANKCFKSHYMFRCSLTQVMVE